MKHILIYSDSLTWGIIPTTRKRLSFDKRWPGIFEKSINQLGANIRIHENCLNGRRTVWSDPFKDGRDGSKGLAQVIEMHSPLALVIIMLGHNDFQCTHNNSAFLSGQGMATLIDIIRKAPIEPEMPIPEIMVVAPPLISNPQGAIANKFMGAEKRGAGINSELQKIAEESSVHFFDSNTVIEANKQDGIHLDAEQHLILGTAVAKVASAFL
jgi:lysophospholipase L1-like esterase